MSTTAKHQAKTNPRVLIRKGLLLLAALLGTTLFLFAIFGIMPAAFKKPELVNKGLVLENRLKVPELLEPKVEGDQKVFDLKAQPGRVEFLDGKQTSTIGYNGPYLGPTIRAHKGDKVRMNVTNGLDQATSAHWHGMHLPAAMDGGPHQSIAQGQSWQPSWTIANEASSLWYHPHLMGVTGEQVHGGLGGLFIIDDANSDSLDLPKTYGTDDLPVIVQDRLFDADGQFIYKDDNADVLGHTGMLGNKILVNGTYGPYVDVPQGQIRLRLLSASNARRYNFGFEDGRTFHQIATDGGFLPTPVRLTRLILAPGERAEIVVDLSSQTQPITLMSYAVYEDNLLLRWIRAALSAQRDEYQMFKILELRPSLGAGKTSYLPQTLNSIERYKAPEVVKTRRFVLEPGSRTINAKMMNHDRIDEVVQTGALEIWEVINLSGVSHPFHIHAVQFQILDRNRRTPTGNDLGWKDTVNVKNAEVVRLIMRFPDYADSHLPYMYHCHILEHEDMGMMGQFVVVAPGTKPEDIRVEGGHVIEPNDHMQH